MTSGEMLERNQRRKFWMTLLAVGVPGIPVGAFIGYTAGRHDMNIAEAVATLSPAIVLVIAASFVTMMVVGTYYFAKAIDEVELQDNLWASSVGYYAYMVLFPTWWLLGTAGVVPGANSWAIYAVALFAGALTYGYRKWRAR